MIPCAERMPLATTPPAQTLTAIATTTSSITEIPSGWDNEKAAGQGNASRSLQPHFDVPKRTAKPMPIPTHFDMRLRPETPTRNT